MVYDKKTWASKEIINTSELQHLEDGVSEVHTLVAEAEQQIDAFPDFNTIMLKSAYDQDNDGKVNLASIADGLTNNDSSKTYNDILTDIDNSIELHSDNSSAHHTRYSDDEARNAINTDSSHGATAQHNYRTDEEIRDVASSMLIAGDGISINIDDDNDSITVSLTDNAFTDDYKTKLYGIETGATADMNASEIVSLINNSSLKIDTDNLTLPTNTFTTEYQTKLDGIEAGATADMNGSEIITAINASSSVINSANINRGNLSTVIERGFIGEVSAGDTIRIFNPRAGTIQSIKLISETQPVGNSLMVDVRKNGTASTNSVFSSDTPMVLTTSASVINGVYKVNGILDSTQVSLAADDVLRVYIVQSGSAVDVSVCIEILY